MISQACLPSPPATMWQVSRTKRNANRLPPRQQRYYVGPTRAPVTPWGTRPTPLRKQAARATLRRAPVTPRHVLQQRSTARKLADRRANRRWHARMADTTCQLEKVPQGLHDTLSQQPVHTGITAAKQHGSRASRHITTEGQSTTIICAWMDVYLKALPRPPPHQDEGPSGTGPRPAPPRPLLAPALTPPAARPTRRPPAPESTQGPLHLLVSSTSWGGWPAPSAGQTPTSGAPS